eukprot:6514309-Pyramimonas_sp.AAC.1
MPAVDSISRSSPTRVRSLVRTTATRCETNVERGRIPSGAVEPKCQTLRVRHPVLGPEVRGVPSRRLTVLGPPSEPALRLNVEALFMDGDLKEQFLALDPGLLRAAD